MYNTNDSGPQGLPAWTAPELIAEPTRVWQPYYSQILTREDVVGILLTVGNVFLALSVDSGQERQPS